MIRETAPTPAPPTLPPPPPRGPSSGRYLPTLDGWRAIAIAGVMVCHGLPYDAAKYGALGVNIFFGISGFLICSRLLEEFHRSGRISLSGFYVRRTFRIFPPYFGYLIILGLLTSAGLIVVTRREFLACILFVRNYLPRETTGLNPLAGWYTGHFWSLAVEEHFYLIWPSLLILLGVARARWAVVPLALAIGAWRIVEYRYQFLAHAGVVVDFYTRTDLCLDGLFWGCWVALLMDDPTWRGRLERWLTPWAWLAILAAFAGIVTLRPPMYLIAQAILIPFLLLGTVLRPGTIVGRALESAPMRWVGRLSYSLYLWQQLFLLEKPAHRAPSFRALQTLPVSLLATFVCASASFSLIEKPMIRLGHRLSRRMARTLPEPHGARRDETSGLTPMES